MKRMLWLGGLSVISLLAGCAKSPDAVVESFYKAIEKGEITEAQAHLSSQVTGMIGPQKLSAALAGETERITQCGGIKSIDIKLEGKGELRTGSTTVTYGGKCPPKSQRVRLVQEDGKWKIVPSK